MPQTLVNTDYVQLPADNTGKKAAFVKKTISGTDLYLPVSVLSDSDGNMVDTAIAALAGTERGIVTRNLNGDINGTGSLTAQDQAVTLTGLNGQATAKLLVRGTFSGTIVVEASDDGTNWYIINGARLNASTGTWASANGLTSTGTALLVPIAGWAQVRARCSVYTSGTIVTSLRASVGAPPPNPLSAAMPALGSGSASIGTMGLDAGGNSGGYVIGSVYVQQAVSTTVTLTQVTGSASSVTILASNSNRTNFLAWNDSTAILYLTFGTTPATAANASVKLLPDAQYESPPVPGLYMGAIYGIWSAANGTAHMTDTRHP